MTGRLIAVEGVDASGKSTQARLLAEALGAEFTFQFGATDVGRLVRGLLLDPANDTLDDRAEAPSDYRRQGSARCRDRRPCDAGWP